ncbi:putative acetyltransferase [Natronospira proteinivora]|uniref:Acetyltransferase n=1 Tax=Natronospira proteinivora TaxID=1807133 RepID=A0ABT1G7Z3_9GAMM|nr:putative acetyltransferase [Natronospira proteinivora]
MHIRRFRIGEERELFGVFHSAIHRVASRDYTPEQINAWAPVRLDQELWARKIRDIKPFVAEINGKIVGYADLQPSGYIDHFFVSGYHPGQGIGRLLMSTLHSEAVSLGLTELTSDVSRTAQPFFEKFGFCIIEQRAPELRGVVVPNALMRKVFRDEA